MSADDNSKRDFLKKAGSMALGAAAIAAPPGLGNASENKKQKPLMGQTALITGGARGIGAAIALKFAQQGANIALIDIADPNALSKTISYKLASQDNLNKTAKQIIQTGTQALPIAADVRSRESMSQAVAKTIETFGRLDIVIANAAIAAGGQNLALEKENILKDTLDVNVSGVANITAASVKYLKKSPQGGRLIAISSISGRQGVAQIASYCASKWAVIGLMKSLSLELGPDNIRVNCIAPTGVKTTMLLGNYTEGDWNSSAMDTMIRGHHSLPVGLLEPEDIANAAAFLASDEAKHISGITLDVNAGLSGKITG